jgi:ABC-type branched-subunit amino acid transport system substrate-binding protein
VQSRQRAAAILAVSAALLAGCGSQVPPNDFVGAAGVGVPAGASGSPVAGTDSNGVPVPVGSSAPDGGGSLAGGGTGEGAGGGGTGVANGGGGGGGGSGNGGGVGGDGSGNGGGGTGATGGVRAGSCAGFRNTTGISDSAITIANVADLSGPVPGLFKSAQAAVTAYAAYFNSTSNICGRTLKLLSLDSGTSESGDLQADTTACGAAFAMVGSLSAFDAGGVSATEDCRIPDLRTLTTEPARYHSSMSYGVYSTAVPEIVRTPFLYFKSLGDAYKSAGYVYLNAGAAIVQEKSFTTALASLGYQFKDEIAIDVTSVPNYNGYATQLKSDGITYVEYTGAYQYAQKLKEAMDQQDYHPVFVLDPVAYDAGYVAAGDAVDGTYSFVPGPLFEEANRNPELRTYIEWLQRTSGGVPTFFGVYAWCAAALFAQLAVELGGKLTRDSLLTAVRGVHNYTNNGMVPPQDPGGKHTTRCASVVQLVDGRWVRKTPYPYTCAPTVDSGVGG